MTKEWYAKNRSYALNYKRMYRVDNLEEVKSREDENYRKHKEARNAYCRNYYKTHKEEVLRVQKARYQKKRDEIRAKQNARIRIKRGNNFMEEKDKLHIKIPSFVGFTEDGTLLVNSNDPAVLAEPEKWKKWDRRFKGKKRIYRRMNVDGKAE